MFFFFFLFFRSSLQLLLLLLLLPFECRIKRSSRRLVYSLDSFINRRWLRARPNQLQLASAAAAAAVQRELGERRSSSTTNNKFYNNLCRAAYPPCVDCSVSQAAAAAEKDDDNQTHQKYQHSMRRRERINLQLKSLFCLSAERTRKWIRTSDLIVYLPSNAFPLPPPPLYLIRAIILLSIPFRSLLHHYHWKSSYPPKNSTDRCLLLAIINIRFIIALTETPLSWSSNVLSYNNSASLRSHSTFRKW